MRPKRVVVVLEAFEVEQREQQRLPRPRLRQEALEVGSSAAPVAEAGEWSSSGGPASAGERRARTRPRRSTASTIGTTSAAERQRRARRGRAAPSIRGGPPDGSTLTCIPRATGLPLRATTLPAARDDDECPRSSSPSGHRSPARSSRDPFESARPSRLAEAAVRVSRRDGVGADPGVVLRNGPGQGSPRRGRRRDECRELQTAIVNENSLGCWEPLRLRSGCRPLPLEGSCLRRRAHVTPRHVRRP